MDSDWAIEKYFNAHNFDNVDRHFMAQIHGQWLCRRKVYYKAHTCGSLEMHFTAEIHGQWLFCRKVYYYCYKAHICGNVGKMDNDYVKDICILIHKFMDKVWAIKTVYTSSVRKLGPWKICGTSSCAKIWVIKPCTLKVSDSWTMERYSAQVHGYSEGRCRIISYNLFQKKLLCKIIVTETLQAQVWNNWFCKLWC